MRANTGWRSVDPRRVRRPGRVALGSGSGGGARLALAARFRQAFVAAVALLVALPAAALLWRKANPNPQRPHRQPADRPRVHARGRRRAEVAVLPLVGEDQRRRHHPVELLHGFGSAAASATRTSTSSGTARRTTSRRSTTSSTASRSSTCRTSVGTQPSKWCAGCHDHAVFFNGRFDKPIKEQIDTPEAQAGLACTSCHAITHVDSSMGNGGFTIEYPPLHELATSKNRYIRAMDHFLTYLESGAAPQDVHEAVHALDSAEFCSTCHKVHLDVPVNNYRWFRGFNDYDNWQASGVSGPGRALVLLPGRADDLRRLPHAAGRLEGSRATATARCTRTASRPPTRPCRSSTRTRRRWRPPREFLKSGFITVDIFAVSPVDEAKGQTPMVRRAAPRRRTAAHDHLRRRRGGGAGGPVVIREVGKVAAPIDKAGAAASSPARRCGSTSWCARARSATSSRAARWTRSTSGSSCRGRTPTASVIFWSGQRGRRRQGAGRDRARTSTAPSSSTARAIRSTSATPGRRAACSMCG